MDSQIEELIKKVFPGQMVYKGMQAGGTSLNGISTDVLKSGIQKYIRRNAFEKALWCTFEMDLLHELQSKGMTNIQGASTNLINRLLIISIEDIGIANPMLIPTMDTLCKLYKLCRFDEKQKDQRRECLYMIVYYLCKSMKSRELSHIRSVFSQVFDFDEEEYILGDDKKEKFLIQDHMKKYPDIYNFSLNDTDWIKAFQIEYKKGSDSCFYWFFKVFNNGGNTDAQKKASVIYLIDYVIREEQNKDRISLMNILRAWFREHSFKEYILFGMQIVLIGLRKPEIKYTDINGSITDNKGTSISEWKTFYMRNLTDGAIQIDDFVIDKHTRQGKKKGKDLAVFATEGACVENEDPNMNKVYKEIYTSFRQLIFPSVSKISKGKSISDKQCEGIYKTGIKAGKRCSNIGKNYIEIPIDIENKDNTTVSNEAHSKSWYCGIHMPKTNIVSSSPVGNSIQTGSSVSTGLSAVKLQFKVKYVIPQDELDKLYSIDTPRGQLLIGKHKKQVFIPMNGTYKNWIIKGPWRGNDIQRLNTMLFRMHSMLLLKVNAVPFSITGCIDENGYTFYKNLSPVEPSQWKITQSYDKNIPVQNKDNNKVHGIPLYGSDVNIVDRDSMGIIQMHKLDAIVQQELLFGDKFLFKGFIMLALLRVGDVGFYNILVVNNVPHIIDYEETTTRASFSSLNNLLAKSVPKYIEMFSLGIKKEREKIAKMIQGIDANIGKIKELALKYGCIYDVDTEWSNIKAVLL